MANIEIDPPKTIVVSKKLLWIIVFFIFAQICLFAFGFYRNLNPQTKIKYVEKTIIVPDTQEPKPVPAIVEPKPPATKMTDITKFGDLPPLPEGWQQRKQQPYATDNQFKFDPPVRDPLEEQLLKDARTSRVKSDMRQVALKLGETLTKFPDSVHAHYQLADMYEAMGIYDKAIEHYEEVFSEGVARAGALYDITAQKLREGFYKELNYGELMAIGTTHQYQNPNITQGQAITITIPILSSPEFIVDPEQVNVDVTIFDKEGNRVVPYLPSNEPELAWKNPSPDWSTNGEEFIIANYYLTNDNQDSIYESLAPRKYYGYVIELYYKGELLDQLAWPRILSNKIAGQSGNELYDFTYDDSYDDTLLPLLPFDNK